MPFSVSLEGFSRLLGNSGLDPLNPLKAIKIKIMANNEGMISRFIVILCKFDITLFGYT